MCCHGLGQNRTSLQPNLALQRISSRMPCWQLAIGSLTGVFLSLTLLVSTAQGADGSLDPTFSHDGKLIRAIGGSADVVKVDARGRYLIAGRTITSATQPTELRLFL